jgi:hypothetical protein
MKVFWSWQSDTPGKVGRFLVRDALGDAITQLKAMPEIEEPVREALHLDHDREGVPGSPELVRTILDKIDTSDVVVADVTLVGTSAPEQSEASPKKLINSNVAIELGYALRALTFRKVLMVFNTHYGRHEELPFDLRHRGGAIVFELAPQADRAAIEAQKRILTQRLASALKLCLTDPAAAAAPEPFPETLHTDSRAAYFQTNASLAQVGERGVDQVEFSYPDGSLCYLRLIPTARRLRPLPLATLTQAARHVPLLTRQRGTILSSPNRFGAIGYEPASPPPRPGTTGKINASTQLFQNGELWSLGASLIVRDRGGRPVSLPLPFVATVVLEQTYYDHLRALLAFATEHVELKLPCQVECGLVGVENLTLQVPPDEFRAVLKPEVVVRRILKTPQSEAIDRILLDFFIELHDTTGYVRPEHMGGFPPARPQWPPGG